MSAAKTAWLALTWIPRGIPKAVANEVAAIGQAFAHPEALARVAQLEAQGKNPFKVAKQEYWQMYLATWPYRFRSMVTEWETCKATVGAGAIDLQELIELAYLLAWMYVFWCLGEMYGRGSIYGYRFDGQEHHDEVQNVILFKEAEAKEMEVVMAKLEIEIAEWMKTLEQEE